MGKLVLLLSLFGVTAPGLMAQSGGAASFPLKVHISQEQAWNTMKEVLEDQGCEITREARVQGSLMTAYRDYMTGPLTESHLRKISTVRKLSDATWIRAEYQYEARLELLAPQETLVTVYANIRGLKRDYFGSESWVDIPSNGHREEDLLTLFGRRLFGEEFRLNQPKKGFWEHSPRYVPDMERTIPKVAGPERP